MWNFVIMKGKSLAEKRLCGVKTYYRTFVEINTKDHIKNQFMMIYVSCYMMTKSYDSEGF